MPLLDQQAVLAAMAYVDLNPIRAKLADRPEASEYTSAQERCEARQRHRATTLAGASPPGPEAGPWIAPIEQAIIKTYAKETAPRITVDDYPTLVNETGRLVREDKRGRIPTNLPPILERLQLDLDAWLGLMRHGGAFGFGSFGAMASRVAEAARRGAKWIIDTTAGLYRADRPPTPSSAPA